MQRIRLHTPGTIPTTKDQSKPCTISLLYSSDSEGLIVAVEGAGVGVHHLIVLMQALSPGEAVRNINPEVDNSSVSQDVVIVQAEFRVGRF